MSSEKKMAASLNFSDLIAQPTNKELAPSNWIKTPYAFTLIGKDFSLLQQEIMWRVSEHLQKCINKYFDDGRDKIKENPKSPFTSADKEELAFSIDLPSLGISSANYARMLKPIRYKDGNPVLKPDGSVVTDNVLQELMDIKFSLACEKVYKNRKIHVKEEMPLFIKAHVEEDRKTGHRSGYIDMRINPYVADYAFNMVYGYVKHINHVPQHTKKRVVPRLYLWLQWKLGKSKAAKKDAVIRCKATVNELKDYLGLVVKDADGNVVRDENTHEICYQYPKYNKFKERILDKAKEELIRMGKENQIDITFDYSEDYGSRAKRGDPDYIIFEIYSTPLGKLHQSGKYREADLFDITEHEVKVQPKVEKKLKVDVGAGQEKWNEFVSLVIEPSEKSLISRLRFVGMKNERFCVECSDEDFEKLREKNGLEQLAKKFFGCPHSLAPVFYRG